MNKKIKGLLIPVGEKCQVVELEGQEHPDGYTSYLKEMYRLVDCDTVTVWSSRCDGIDFWIDDEGLLNGTESNRAIFANKKMVNAGLISEFTHQPVKLGNVVTVLFGNILALRTDEDGNCASLTDEDIDQLKREFDRIDLHSGSIALAVASLGIDPTCAFNATGRRLALGL